MSRYLWAVLLAGGGGVRLRDLTLRIAGDSGPKQFCRQDGPSLRALLVSSIRGLDVAFNRNGFREGRAYRNAAAL
jgi:hypothetical protein